MRLWVGQGFSFVGDAVSMVALVVLVARLTGNASAVGGLLVVQLLPTLASPFVGVLADRLDRRIILVTSDLVRAALIAAAVLTENLVVLYALVFLMGVARTFFNPTIRAAFPSVVGEGDLTRANALISGTFSFSVMAGPALGGLLVASVGVDAAFLVDAATYLVSAALLSLIPLPATRGEGEASFVEELRDGLRYLAGARIPLVVVIGTFLTILTMNVTVPAEVFLATETFGAGDAGYGLLVSVWGGGMILGSGVMAALGNRFNTLLLYLLGIFISGLTLAATGMAPGFVLALVALTIAGFSNGIDNVTRDTILQEQVPDAFLGRVFSIRFLSYSVAESLAYPAGGLMVDAVGPRYTYLYAGAATTAAGLLIVLLIAIVPRRRT